MDWKPIETLELREYSDGRKRSDDVILWVSGGEYSYRGPIIGAISQYKDGIINIDISAIRGYEFDNDFKDEDVAYWAPLPIGPKE